MEHAGLTSRIIAAAIDVHRALGPGFLEVIYERALLIELRRRAIPVESQVDVRVMYNGVSVGEHILDLLVEKTIVVELKAIKNLEDIHFATVRSYLRAMGLEHGLLLNFNKPTLEIKRVIARPIEREDRDEEPDAGS